MHNNKLYIIENLTSLHVGSGDTNMGVIDNLVQRDVLTAYPTIHSSSLKGALKEFTSHLLKYPENATGDEEIQSRYNALKYIFGDESLSGMVRFMEAHLLAIPMRSDIYPYHLCVSHESIKNYLAIAKTFGIKIDALGTIPESSSILVKEGNPTIEEYTAQPHDDAELWDALEKLVGEPVAIVPHALFEALLEDLPVIARNQLENGVSKNLFYEEVVPKKSKFFTVISYPTYLNKRDINKIQPKFDAFHESLIGDNLIQMGANASIGYGVTAFSLGGES